MNRILNLIVLFTFLLFLNSCVGYEPIFSSTNLQFKIVDYSIKGNKVLGKQIRLRFFKVFTAHSSIGMDPTMVIGKIRVRFHGGPKTCL